MRKENLFLESGAVFSPCKKHRLDLWRVWDKEKPYAAFILLNPSTADETIDDPTITRCIKYSKTWGYGGLHVLNLYSVRATDPKKLYPMDEMQKSLYAENLEKIELVCWGAAVIVLGWGKHGNKVRMDYGSTMAKHLSAFDLSALSVNKDGSPKHPLYLRGDLKPQPY